MGLKYNNFCENITPYHSRRSMYHALVNAFLSPPLAWREESYFDEIPVIVQGQCHENGMCGTHNNRPTTILSLIHMQRHSGIFTYDSSNFNFNLFLSKPKQLKNTCQQYYILLHICSCVYISFPSALSVKEGSKNQGLTGIGQPKLHYQQNSTVC